MYRFITFPFLVNYEFYHVLGSFVIMLVVLRSAALKSIFSIKIFSYIGKFSFSFYLLHFIILCSFSCYIFKVFYPTYTYNLSVLLAIFCSLPIIALTAVFYYYWVDKMGIRLSDKILDVFVSKS
jgi:peptidoglycan/LPS O-acetylase OafA/YrhL